jgi:hypothetical protein
MSGKLRRPANHSRGDPRTQHGYANAAGRYPLRGVIAREFGEDASASLPPADAKSVRRIDDHIRELVMPGS